LGDAHGSTGGCDREAKGSETMTYSTGSIGSLLQGRRPGIDDLEDR